MRRIRVPERARRRPRSQRGAALVEAALVTPVVMLVILGSIELSMLSSSHLALGTAVAEAGREASIARDDSDADTQILTELRSRLDPVDADAVTRVIIYAPTGPNAPPSTSCSNGTEDGSCNVYSSLRPTAAELQCVASIGLCPGERDPRSLLGIEVRFVHQSLTGILGRNINLSRRSIVAIEPPV
jgi:Flp pilus assembly protein TadG